MALSNIVSKLRQYVSQNPDKARQALGKIQQTVDQRTGGKYRDQIEKASTAAENQLGLPSQPNQPGQANLPNQPGQATPPNQPGQANQPNQPGQANQPNQPGTGGF